MKKQMLALAMLACMPFVPLAGADVIIDNLDAEAFVPADWSTSSKAGQWGTDMRFGRNSTTPATFSPNLPTAGVWGVEMWWPTQNNGVWPAQTHVTISHAGGNTVEIVQQKALGGEWLGVGWYEFNAGSGVRLAIDPSLSSGAEVVADGVRFREDPIGMKFRQGTANAGFSGNPKSNVAGTTAQLIADVPVDAAYDLYVNYNQNGNRDPGAIVRIYDGVGNLIDTTTVDMTVVGDTAMIGNYTFSNQPIVQVEGSGGGYTDFTGTSYVLTEIVPEPTTAAVLGFGALALAIRRRRQSV